MGRKAEIFRYDEASFLEVMTRKSKWQLRECNVELGLTKNGNAKVDRILPDI
jgi:hypothetical protein